MTSTEVIPNPDQPDATSRLLNWQEKNRQLEERARAREERRAAREKERKKGKRKREIL